MIRRRLESYVGHVGKRLSVAAGVALVAGMMAGTAWGNPIVSQGSGNWGTAGTWSGGVPQSGDDVYIRAGDTVTMTGTAAIPINSLTITGTLTHAAVTTAGSTVGDEDNMINLAIAGNLTIDTAGQITVDGMGYAATKGPGAGGGDRGGGSYGGKGTLWGTTKSPYGSITNPVNSGSGGANFAGGGAVVILVTGAITNSGTITAKGNTAGNKGNGSGGTINLTAASITSTGIIRADGIPTGDPGASGGGRIALRLTGDLQDFANVDTNKVTAYGATTAFALPDLASSAGTIYLKTKAQTYGTLIVKNNNLNTTLDTPVLVGTNRFDAIYLQAKGILGVSSNRLLDLTGCTLSSDSPAGDMANSRVGVDTTAGGGQFIVGPAAYTIPTNVVISFRGTNRMSLACDLTIAAGGSLTHESGGGSRIDLDLTGNLTINSGGAINLYGMGYAGGGGTGGAGVDDGGSHGGKGGYWSTDNTGTTYGSITNPVQNGSGGYPTPSKTERSAGGGAVVLRVTGALTNEGTINAKGVGTGSSARGGGAGGSINLTADSISGTAGAITANGGTAETGGGGGGRIAVRLTGTGQTFPASVSANITAYGGEHSYSETSARGAAGTIYLKTKEQDRGVLLVKNNVNSSRSTLIASGMADEAVGDVQLAGTAAQITFEIASGRTLPVYGSWSNAATSTIGGTGTVEFKGATTNTIYGSTTFNSLVCTNAGKTLLFQAGTTNTVTGVLGLRLTGASGDGNKVSLLPATPFAQWYIKAMSTPADVSYVAVSNSTVDTSGGAVGSITAKQSVNLGGNTNWVFADPDSIFWISTSSTNWNTAANWVTAGGVTRVPLPDDPSITISNGTATATLIDASYTYSGNLFIQSGATMNLNGKALTIGGCLTNAGTLVATASETLTVSKDVDFTGGTFTPASSTFRLAAPAAGAQTFKPDGKTFYRIEVPNASTLNVSGGGFTAAQLYCRAAGATLNFQEGLAYAVTDLLDLRGTSGSKVILRRIGSTTQWNLNLSGQRQMVRYVDVQDSNASGKTIYAIDSIGASGNNVNWNFTNGKFWTGGTTDWATSGNWSPSGAPGATNYVIIDGSTGSTVPALSGATDITGLNVDGPVTLTVNMAYGQILNVSNDVYIGNGAGLTHSAVTSTGNNNENSRLLMHVGGDFTLAAGGVIDVSEKGYDSVQGPGAGSSASNARGGGGHGGEGGNGYQGTGSGTTYGSITNPVRCGSGGSNGRGGGCVVLTIDGAATINGTIAAKGGKPVNTGGEGGGSGGTVNIVASTISGTGTLTVMGGYGSDSGGAAGGGGGRIAMRLTTGPDTQFGTLTIQAYGGPEKNYNELDEPGAAGTIYLKGANQSYGRLLVDHNLSTTRRMLISSNVTDAAVGDVVLKTLGYMGIATGQTLTVYGSWSNAVATNAISGGTVALAGSAAATVWGGNTWSNLTIATAGKTVNFEAGKTQFVYGVASFSNVTLQSTASAYWYLLKPGSGTQDVGNVTVQYSNATNGWAFRPSGGQNLGNNVNWIFPPKGTVIMMR